MTLASSNSLHQGLDPLPTQLFVAISDRPPVQQITERNRIKQRIIRVEVALHLLPKMLASQKTRTQCRTLDFALRLVKTMSAREGSGLKTKSRALCPQYESGNHFPGSDPRTHFRPHGSVRPRNRHDFDTNPHLCVFDGVGSRVDPRKNKCPISVGRNFRLDETLKLAVNVKNAVCMWGPYEIKKEAFDLAVKRKQLLDGGTIGYRADDRLDRKDRVAINCFHAIAGLEELYPNGGFLGTGFRMWGINGTARVLIEYTKSVRDKGLLLEPVDIKKDLYGFVYAPERNSRGLYNPFPNASAYHQ
jgi:hypothetical protein